MARGGSLKRHQRQGLVWRRRSMPSSPDTLASPAHLLPRRGGGGAGRGRRAPASRPASAALARPRAGSGSLCGEAGYPHCRGPCGPPGRRAPAGPSFVPADRLPTVCGCREADCGRGAPRRCPVHQHHLGAIRVPGSGRETPGKGRERSVGIRGSPQEPGHVASLALVSDSRIHLEVVAMPTVISCSL